MTSQEFKNSIIKKFRNLQPTANQATRQILDYLNMSGFYAWRQNNAAVYDEKKGVHRAGHTENGVADIIGIHKATGKMIAIEVKVGKDKLSPDQIRFLDQIRSAGGLACAASCAGDVVEYLENNLKNK